MKTLPLLAGIGMLILLKDAPPLHWHSLDPLDTAGIILALIGIIMMFVSKRLGLAATFMLSGLLFTFLAGAIFIIGRHLS